MCCAAGEVGSIPGQVEAADQAAADEAVGWYTAHKHLKTRAVLVPFFVALSALLMTPAVVHTALNRYSAATGAAFVASTGWNCDNGSSTIILTIYNVVFILIFAAMAYQTRYTRPQRLAAAAAATATAIGGRGGPHPIPIFCFSLLSFLLSLFLSLSISHAMQAVLLVAQCN